MRLYRAFGILAFFVTMLSHDIHGTDFKTLSEAQEYATLYPEMIQTDNADPLRPDFSSFHKQNRPSMWRRIASWFGASYPVWDARKCKTLLKNITTARELDGFQGEFVERYKPRSGDRIFIWGSLFGAFHSLVRDLTFMNEEGILDNSFKIVKPNCVFIFNGDVIEGSPYVLETLTLVLRLMQMNPSRVFYIKGYQEDKERWHNFELARELKIRARHISREPIPLNDFLGRFFNTLPLGLYITHEQSDVIEAVLVANRADVVSKIDEKKLTRVFGFDEKRGFFKQSKDKETRDKKIEVKAYVTGEDRSTRYHKTDGLMMLSSMGGATTWLVFSSPTERSQILYQFFYDAFVQISAEDGIQDWTISLFNQKVPELKGFKESAIFNLVSGWQLKKKGDQKQEKVVRLGSTMDLSKGASPIGKRVKEGLELAFDKEHTTNAVPGIIPELITIDDEYTPRQTRNAIDKMVQNDITTFIGSQGSASLESYLDLIQDGKVLVLFPFTGAPIFRKPNLKHLIHYRGSYIREGETLMDYAIRDLKSKRIAIFYQDDAFGRGALEGARRVLKAAGISNFLEVPHERNVADYKKQATKINDFNPDTILFSTNALAIRGLIRQMGVQYFAGKKLLGLSVYEDAFERFLKDKGLTFILIRMVPDPATSELEIVKEYREWADRHNVAYDKVSLEQFINANILFEILSTIEKPVTNEKIIAAAEKMKQYPFKGLLLDFNPATRELSGDLWLDTGEGAWILKSNRDKDSAIKKIDEAALEQVDTTFRLATVTDFSKGIKWLGRSIQAGIDLRLEQAREQKDQFVPSIVFVDDQYTPSITRKEVARLLQKGIYTLLLPTGSATLEAYIDWVKEEKLLVLFPITGAPIFRKPDLKYIIHFRSSYDEEGRALTKYATDTMRAKRLLFFYQDDAFGLGLLQAAREFLKGHAAQVKEVPYERNEIDFEKQVKAIRDYDPDVLVFFSTAMAAKNLIRQIGVTNLLGKKLLGCSDLGQTQLVNFVRDLNLDFVYANVLPNPETSQIEIVKEFRQIAKRNGVVLDVNSMEAYIATDLLLNTINKVQGNVTNEKLVELLTSIKNENYKGLKLNFDSEERTLLHSIWLDTGKPDWLEVWVD